MNAAVLARLGTGHASSSGRIGLAAVGFARMSTDERAPTFVCASKRSTLVLLMLTAFDLDDVMAIGHHNGYLGATLLLANVAAKFITHVTTRKHSFTGLRALGVVRVGRTGNRDCVSALGDHLRDGGITRAAIFKAQLVARVPTAFKLLNAAPRAAEIIV